MTWSYRLGSIFGIDIRVHLTFLLLLGAMALTQTPAAAGGVGFLGGLFATTVLFGIVVMHELGHALAARHYGIRTRDITLLPFGGVAQLEREPRRAREELFISLAGPAVNVGLAALVGLLALAISGPGALGPSSLLHGSLLGRLFWINVGLAVFNMVPAFPMDGGRVLRAALELRIGHVRATRIAARLGQALAVAFGLWAIATGQLLMATIALFVWLGARQELARTLPRLAAPEVVVFEHYVDDPWFADHRRQLRRRF